MKIFSNEKTYSGIKLFNESICAAAERLKPPAVDLAEEKDIKDLAAFIKNFGIKSNDLLSENRKLNIGVVGQVKAGKSTFLNTLLFDGREILPKAATPKTAALTKMEYSDKNSIEIEYYNLEEWKELEENAKIDNDSDVFTSAREIMAMMKKRSIDPYEYAKREKEYIEFDTYDDLILRLNDYVGEDGKYTPLVKAVVLHLNRPEFEGLSIVDTPDLNDPIVSRALRTKEFIEVCDVVFFLSKSSYFLDQSDSNLLFAQMPEKGVKKLVLIASKYDDAIFDVLSPKVKVTDSPFSEDDTKADNIPDACKKVVRKLRGSARRQIKNLIEKERLIENNDVIVKTLKECKGPLFVSSIAHNMIGKAPSDYNKEEQNLYKRLESYSEDIDETLKLIGNIDDVKRVFDEVAAQKESILIRKIEEFIPTNETEFRTILNGFKNKSEKKLKLLSGNDRDAIIKQKNAAESQINSIKSDIAVLFGEWISKLESRKLKTTGEIRAALREHKNVRERTGEEQHEEYYDTYKYQFLFFKWGKETHSYTTTTTYTYLCVSDITDSLRNYVMECAGKIENAFESTISQKEMKRRLLSTVKQNFDTGSENYDASLFILIVERFVNKIEFPIIKIETEEAVSNIASSFSGEIRNSSDKDSLRRAYSSALEKFYNILIKELEKNIISFKKGLEEIQESIQTELLKDVNSEFNEISAKFENKEREIEKYKSYISALENELKIINVY